METIQTVLNSGSWAMYLFIFGLIFLGATLLFFRSGVAFFIQLIILILCVAFGTIPMVGIILTIIQVVFSIYLLYRLEKAFEYNIQLVLEKTHATSADITKSGNGSQFSFLK